MITEYDMRVLATGKPSPFASPWVKAQIQKKGKPK